MSFGGDGARIHRAESGALTAPSTAAAAAIVRDYLRDHVQGAVDQLTLVSHTPSRGGISHVRFEQTVGGLRVYGAYAKAAITDRGELLQVIENLAPTGALPRAASILPVDALAIAMLEHGFHFATPAQTRAVGNTHAFAKGTEFYREPTVERVAYVDGGKLEQGFLVETWSGNNNQLDHTLISRDGKIVAHELRTANDRYNVFVEDPNKNVQTIVDGPGAGNAESPVGWLTGNQTTRLAAGNNARAYIDADNNNAPDGGGAAVTNGDFLAVADLTQAPSTDTNRDVAVQNLFYLNNIVHDVLYRHGFVEAEGNFQADNFGLGGLGNDPVNAEAQDGGGTDNANFATPADGSSPRMQMYLWTGSAPNALVEATSGTFGAYESSFGGTLSSPKTGATQVASPADACTAVAPLTGKIALVDRGACNFTDKVLNAQKAGAVAVIIANNIPGDGAFSPGGTARRVTIPSVMVSFEHGGTLKAAAGESATLRRNPAPALMVDASLDADIVYHEYGHGLTWRMIGSMNGAMSGAIGEGASDTLAFLINGDDRIAEYSASNARGIRRFPYQDYPNTYADFAGESVHNDGEIYAGAMWRVMQNYLVAGLTTDDVLDDWVGGMSFTAAAPHMEHMRDGMLAAAPAARACLIWRGFAATGIGVGAQALQKGRRFTITESFEVPATFQ